MLGQRKLKPQVSLKRDDLEAYQRLIALQKEMIDLMEQNEQARRECSALRTQVSQDAERLYRIHTSLAWRVRKSAWWLLRFLLNRATRSSGKPARLSSPVFLRVLSDR